MGMLMFGSRPDRTIKSWVWLDAGEQRILTCDAIARIDSTPGTKLGHWRDDAIVEQLIAGGFAFRQKVAAYLTPDAVSIRRQFRRLVKTERLSSHAVQR